jgi:hypothetical protein
MTECDRMFKHGLILPTSLRSVLLLSVCHKMNTNTIMLKFTIQCVSPICDLVKLNLHIIHFRLEPVFQLPQKTGACFRNGQN